MAEPIIEQLTAWIATALDGKQDPDLTLTLKSVRPGMEEWDLTSFSHGDCIIEVDTVETADRTSTTRQEKGTWKIYGIVTTLPSSTGLDTVMSRMAETIRRSLLAGNNDTTPGKACGGLAQTINCPHVIYSPGPMVIVTTEVEYWTDYKDGYSQ